MKKIHIIFISGLAAFLTVLSFVGSPVQAADTIDVTAKVPATLPVQPPVITSPDEGQHFTNKTITVSGTCDAYTAYVTILRNGVLAGAAPCVANSFTLSISLVLGQNVLIATAYSATSDPGPSSIPVTVYYDLPSETPIPPASSDFVVPPNRNLPLAPYFGFMYITADRAFIAQPIGSQWQWQLTIHNATSPYKVTINWGDVTDVQTQESDSFAIKHIYKQPGVYIVKIRATDTYNSKAQLQLIAVVQGTQPFTDHNKTQSTPNYEPIIIGTISASILAIVAGFGLLFIFQPKAAFTAGRLLKRLFARKIK